MRVRRGHEVGPHLVKRDIRQLTPVSPLWGHSESVCEAVGGQAGALEEVLGPAPVSRERGHHPRSHATRAPGHTLLPMSPGGRGRQDQQDKTRVPSGRQLRAGGPGGDGDRVGVGGRVGDTSAPGCSLPLVRSVINNSRWVAVPHPLPGGPSPHGRSLEPGGSLTQVRSAQVGGSTGPGVEEEPRQGAWL